MSDRTRDFARRLLAAIRLLNAGGLTIVLISARHTALAVYAGTADGRRGR